MKKKITAPKIYSMKNKEKIAMITSYDCPTTKIVESAGIDIILVGDSVGMVLLGYPTTLEVTVDDIIHHSKAVSRCSQYALKVGDMPFMSYQTSVEEAVKNAGRIIQEGGMDAVKLEGGENHIDKIKAILNAGIPVMGHVGLTPQSVNLFGGFKIQGKTAESAKQILKDAILLDQAGVFAIVLEGIPEELAKVITESVSCPTIGIGAGRFCDGQVLVFHDMLSIPEPCYFKFVKQFENAGEVMKNGVENYVKAVKENEFPGKDNVTHISEEILKALKDKGGLKCI
ncbi:3-methyl-2-oxobutanoate hydroxymethyltransferase [Thermotomaculum hydrothermale]|uniref:3-methyl-2-oxobutanoate hydroxymethyltransferase n=1 Tax=Thermotomaculum hydrothermale TaxID=981385 RepID=A0A7R6PG51_9BACT|nr:3-methyl-2-oxobutanoate hydroxymethyltransferase [Thermotomaculum hydrothermale]BBB31974.1 3-methyl-2-oxobutanoate hydroxymethyltransferase [Thermotomaculum hydrothermale]